MKLNSSLENIHEVDWLMFGCFDSFSACSGKSNYSFPHSRDGIYLFSIQWIHWISGQKTGQSHLCAMVNSNDSKVPLNVVTIKLQFSKNSSDFKRLVIYLIDYWLFGFFDSCSTCSGKINYAFPQMFLNRKVVYASLNLLANLGDPIWFSFSFNGPSSALFG